METKATERPWKLLKDLKYIEQIKCYKVFLKHGCWDKFRDWNNLGDDFLGFYGNSLFNGTTGKIIEC